MAEVAVGPESAVKAPDADRCPRCGGGFHCGVNDAQPCACTTARLTDTLRAGLRRRYTGCLCLGCLRAVSAGAPL